MNITKVNSTSFHRFQDFNDTVVIELADGSEMMVPYEDLAGFVARSEGVAVEEGEIGKAALHAAS